MLKYPAVKSICLAIVSSHGAGKGEWIDTNKKMMGENKVLETRKPQEDVWGKFNGGMLNAFFVAIDELEKCKCKDAVGEIKGLITNTGGFHIETKEKDRIKIKCNI